MSRLETVLWVRRLVERQRAAEQATTAHAVARARAIRDAAVAAREVRPVPTGLELDAAQVVLERLGGLALQDDVTLAEHQLLAAAREDELATSRRIAAAVGRRSVERLDERRRAESARVAARRAEQQLDAVALERWRRT